MPKATCPYELRTAEFEVELFEVGLRNDPDNLELLELLAMAYTTCGRYADGLALDLRLTELLPRQNLAFYNLACSYSLIGDAEASVEALARAIALGYDEFEHLLTDDDLLFVRQHPAFSQIRRSIEERGGV